MTQTVEPARLSQAQVELIEAHYDTAIKVAERYARRRSMDRADCVSTAHETLVEAAEKFDASGSTKFVELLLVRLKLRLIDLSRASSQLSPKQVKQLQSLREAQDQGHLSQALAGEIDPLVSSVFTTGDLEVSWDEAGEASMIAADPAENAIQEREWTYLRTAISSLPPDMAEVLLLIYWHQMTFAEAAQEIGLPAARLYKLHSRAIGYLRDALADAGWSDEINAPRNPMRISAGRKIFLDRISSAGNARASTNTSLMDLGAPANLALVGSLASLPIMSLTDLLAPANAA